jgi:DNA-binding CsgD family transcriptional regulator
MRLEAGGLLERERELALLDRALAPAVGGAGRLLIVEGPPGIGKSALLEAARERACAAGVRVLWARAGVLERSYPYGVAAQLLGGRLRVRAGDLEGRPRANGRQTPVGADARRFLLLEALWRRLAARAPALVCVDDLHWSDPESVRLLAFSATRLEQRPVVLLVALRPREPGSDWGALTPLLSHHRAVVLRPGPLSIPAVGVLLAARGLTTATEELATACHRSTGGNPFLVGELARTLVARGVSGDDPQAASMTANLAPDGLGRAVLARLGGLSEDAVALAGALAVLGGRARLELAATLAGLDAGAAAVAADLLADAEVLQGGRPLEFLHPVVRAAVYQDMRPSARRQAHRRAAAILAQAPRADLDQIAAHLLECDPAGEAWVADRLEQAARSALEHAAPGTAVLYLQRALREPPPDGHIVDLLCLLGDAQLRAGSAERPIEAFQAALERAGDPVLRARVAARLQVALTHLQRGDQGAALLVAAIADLPATKRELGLELEAQLALAGLLQADAARVTAARRPRFSAPRRPPRSRGELVSIAAQACRASVRGSAQEADALAQLALRDGTLLVQEGPEAPLFYLAVCALIHADRLRDAESALNAAIDLARERRSQLGEAIARAIRAEARQRAGLLAAAAGDATVALRAVRCGLRFGPRPALRALVLALIDQGRLLEAARTLEGLELGESSREAAAAAIAHARGCLRAALGQDATALEDFDLCARLEASFEVIPPVIAPWRSSKALSLAALGRAAEALALAHDEVGLARAYGAPRALGIALTAAGRLSDDIDTLREAVAVLERSEARLEHARAQLALGSALRRRGQRVAARAPLREALARARRCGAVAVAEQAHDELRRAGARPRKVVRAGADALTPAERRVAELAADERTNRQIAAELTLSVRTIESHLAHAYEKLDITSRRQLATALTGEPTGRFITRDGDGRVTRDRLRRSPPPA